MLDVKMQGVNSEEGCCSGPEESGRLHEEGMGQLGWEGRRTHRSTDSQSWEG